jgi:DNA-binding response OmpR family regulator
MRVLVIEDFLPLRTSLQRGLREAGYAVDAVADGVDGLAHAQTSTYDVIVLDVMLPRLDGLSVLRRLRAERCPSRILMLTAKDTLQDRLMGLDNGADDYVVKPFAFEELLARIRVLIRRRYEQSTPRIEVGDLVIDTVGRLVRRGARDIELTAREYAILEVLAARPGGIVTREEIEERVYDFASERGSNVVDVYIGYLRRKLEQDGDARLIHTRRGLGYVLAVAEPE